MSYRSWLIVVVLIVLLAICAWVCIHRAFGAPAPTSAPASPPALTSRMVEGAYSVAPRSCQNFTFVLLPNGAYRGHFSNFNNCTGQDWSGTWRLDPIKQRVYITEWVEGTEWYGDVSQAAGWYINIKRDSKGRIIREGYVCKYYRGN